MAMHRPTGKGSKKSAKTTACKGTTSIAMTCKSPPRGGFRCCTSAKKAEHTFDPFCLDKPLPLRRDWFVCAMCCIEKTTGCITSEGHGPTLGNAGSFQKCEPLYVDEDDEGKPHPPVCVGHVCHAFIGSTHFVSEARHLGFGAKVTGVYWLMQEKKCLVRSDLPNSGPVAEAWVPINQDDIRDIWTHGLRAVEGPFGKAVYLFYTCGDARRHCKRKKSSQFLVRVSVHVGTSVRVYGSSRDAWAPGVDSLDTGTMLVVKDPVRVLIESSIRFETTPSLAVIQEGEETPPV